MDITHFRDAPPGFLDLINNASKEVEFEDGATIIRINTRGKSIYTITEGEVLIKNRDGRVLVTLGPGTLVGEISVLGGGRSTATVEASGHVKCLSVSKVAIDDALESYPSVRRSLKEMADARLARDAERQKLWNQMESTAYARWLNHLLEGEVDPIVDEQNVENSFTDGLRLNALAKVLTGKTARYTKRPNFPAQFTDNLNIGIKVFQEYFKEQFGDAQVNDIGVSNFTEGDRKMVFGFLSTLYQRFVVSKLYELTKDIESHPFKSDMLTVWCRRLCRLQGGKVTVKDFHHSWQSGLAFLSILRTEDPDLVPNWDDLSETDGAAEDTLEQAFSLASERFGIPRLLDVEAMLRTTPDSKSIRMYLVLMFMGLDNARAQACVPLEDDEAEAELSMSFHDELLLGVAGPDANVVAVHGSAFDEDPGGGPASSAAADKAAEAEAAEKAAAAEKAEAEKAAAEKAAAEQAEMEAEAAEQAKRAAAAEAAEAAAAAAKDALAAELAAEREAHAHTRTEAASVAARVAELEAAIAAGSEKNSQLESQLSEVENLRRELQAALEAEKRERASSVEAAERGRTAAEERTAELEAHSASLSDKVKELESANQRSEDELASLTVKFEAAQSGAGQQSSRVKELEAELAAALARATKLEASLDQATGRVDKLEQDVAAAADAKTASEAQSTALQSDVANLRGQLAAVKEAASSTEKRLTDEVASAKADAEAARAAAAAGADGLAAQVKELEAELARVRGEADVSAAGLSDCESSKAVLQTEVAELQDHIRELEAGLASAAAEAREEHSARIAAEARADAAEASVQHTEADLASSAAELTRLKEFANSGTSRASEAEGRAGVLSQELAAVNEKLSDTQKELLDCQSNATSLRAELEASRSREARLETAAAQAAKKAEASEATVAELRSKISALEDEARRSAFERSRATSASATDLLAVDAAKARADAQAAARAKCEEEKARLRSELSSAKADTERLAEELAAMSRERDSAKGAVEAQELIVASLREQVSEGDDRYRSSQAKVSDLTTALDAAKREVAESEAAHETVTAQLKRYKDQVAELGQSAVNLRKQALDAEAAAKRLEASLEVVSEERDGLKEDLREAEVAKTEAETALSALEAQRAVEEESRRREERARTSSETEKAGSATREAARLRAELDSLLSRAAQLETSNGELASELKATKARAEEASAAASASEIARRKAEGEAEFEREAAVQAQSELEAVLSQMAELQEERADLQAELTQLNQTLCDVTAENVELAGVRDELAKLTVATASASGRATIQSSVIAELQEEASRHEARVVELESLEDELRAELATAKAALSAEQAAREKELQFTQAAQAQEIAELNEQLAALETERDSAEELSGSLSAHAAALEAELAAAQAELAESGRGDGDVDGSLGRLEQALDEAKARADRLQAELAVEMRRRAESEGIADAQAAICESTKAKLAATQSELKEARRALLRLQSQAGDGGDAAVIAELEREVGLLTDKDDELAAEGAALRAEAEARRARLQSLRGEVAQLTSQVEASRADNKAAAAEVDELTAAEEKLTAEMGERRSERGSSSARSRGGNTAGDGRGMNGDGSDEDYYDSAASDDDGAEDEALALLDQEDPESLAHAAELFRERSYAVSVKDPKEKNRLTAMATAASRASAAKAEAIRYSAALSQLQSSISEHERITAEDLTSLRRRLRVTRLLLDRAIDGADKSERELRQEIADLEANLDRECIRADSLEEALEAARADAAAHANTVETERASLRRSVSVLGSRREGKSVIAVGGLGRGLAGSAGGLSGDYSGGEFTMASSGGGEHSGRGLSRNSPGTGAGVNTSVDSGSGQSGWGGGSNEDGGAGSRDGPAFATADAELVDRLQQVEGELVAREAELAEALVEVAQERQRAEVAEVEAEHLAELLEEERESHGETAVRVAELHAETHNLKETGVKTGSSVEQISLELEVFKQENAKLFGEVMKSRAATKRVELLSKENSELEASLLEARREVTEANTELRALKAAHAQEVASLMREKRAAHVEATNERRVLQAQNAGLSATLRSLDAQLAKERADRADAVADAHHNVLRQLRSAGPPSLGGPASGFVGLQLEVEPGLSLAHAREQLVSTQQVLRSSSSSSSGSSRQQLLSGGTEDFESGSDTEFADGGNGGRGLSSTKVPRVGGGDGTVSVAPLAVVVANALRVVCGFANEAGELDRTETLWRAVGHSSGGPDAEERYHVAARALHRRVVCLEASVVSLEEEAVSGSPSYRGSGAGSHVAIRPAGGTSEDGDDGTGRDSVSDGVGNESADGGVDGGSGGRRSDSGVASGMSSADCMRLIRSALAHSGTAVRALLEEVGSDDDSSSGEGNAGANASAGGPAGHGADSGASSASAGDDVASSAQRTGRDETSKDGGGGYAVVSQPRLLDIEADCVRLSELSECTTPVDVSEVSGVLALVTEVVEGLASLCEDIVDGADATQGVLPGASEPTAPFPTVAGARAASVAGTAEGVVAAEAAGATTGDDVGGTDGLNTVGSEARDSAGHSGDRSSDPAFGDSGDSSHSDSDRGVEDEREESDALGMVDAGAGASSGRGLHLTELQGPTGQGPTGQGPTGDAGRHDEHDESSSETSRESVDFDDANTPSELLESSLQATSLDAQVVARSFEDYKKRTDAELKELRDELERVTKAAEDAAVKAEVDKAIELGNLRTALASYRTELESLKNGGSGSGSGGRGSVLPRAKSDELLRRVVSDGKLVDRSAGASAAAGSDGQTGDDGAVWGDGDSGAPGTSGGSGTDGSGIGRGSGSGSANPPDGRFRGSAVDRVGGEASRASRRRASDTGRMTVRRGSILSLGKTAEYVDRAPLEPLSPLSAGFGNRSESGSGSSRPPLAPSSGTPSASGQPRLSTTAERGDFGGGGSGGGDSTGNNMPQRSVGRADDGAGRDAAGGTGGSEVGGPAGAAAGVATAGAVVGVVAGAALANGVAGGQGDATSFGGAADEDSEAPAGSNAADSSGRAVEASSSSGADSARAPVGGDHGDLAIGEGESGENGVGDGGGAGHVAVNLPDDLDTDNGIKDELNEVRVAWQRAEASCQDVRDELSQLAHARAEEHDVSELQVAELARALLKANKRCARLESSLEGLRKELESVQSKWTPVVSGVNLTTDSDDGDFKLSASCPTCRPVAIRNSTLSMELRIIRDSWIKYRSKLAGLEKDVGVRLL